MPDDGGVVPGLHHFLECLGLALCLFVGQKTVDGRGQTCRRQSLLADADGKAFAHQTIHVDLLLRLHGYTHDGRSGQARGHQRADAAVDDRHVGQGIDFVRRQPVGDQHIIGDPHAGHFVQVRLHRGDDAIRLAGEALDDAGDYPWLARTAHGEIDNGPVVGQG